MNSRIPLLALTAAVAASLLATCARDNGDEPSAPVAANESTTAFDLKFIDTMTAHHQSALDMARLAENKAAHPELRAMASKMREAQKAEIDQMSRWRGQWFAGAPSRVDHEMEGMKESMAGMDMSKLERSTGNEFDHHFVDMMIKHHDGALRMANEALAKATRPEIKQLAQTIVSDQTREISQLQASSKQWFGHAEEAPRGQ